jgi:hypothetical protein
MSCSERQKSLIIAAQMKTFVAKIIKIQYLHQTHSKINLYALLLQMQIELHVVLKSRCEAFTFLRQKK